MLNIAMSITPFSRSSLERASVFYVRQYSMQITASGGSEFSANQHSSFTTLMPTINPTLLPCLDYRP
jgi:hypothetical protein